MVEEDKPPPLLLGLLVMLEPWDVPLATDEDGVLSWELLAEFAESWGLVLPRSFRIMLPWLYMVVVVYVMSSLCVSRCCRVVVVVVESIFSVVVLLSKAWPRIVG